MGLRDMSFNPLDYRSSMVDCPDCGHQHQPAYRLTKCAHPGCTVLGCHLCLRVCSYSTNCGRFCDAHLVETDMAGLREPLCACFRCMAEGDDVDEQADPSTVEQNVAALIVMAYLRDMLTVSPKEMFSRVELLVVIDDIMSDRGLFAAEAMERFAAIEAAVEV
jgi:hypothetical protein